MPRKPAGMDKPTRVWPNIRRILKYMTDKKWILVVVFILEIVMSLASVGATYLLGPIIDDGITPLIDKTLTAEALRPFIRLLLMLVALYLINLVFTSLVSVIMAYITNHTLNTIRDDLFHKMADLPLS